MVYSAYVKVGKYYLTVLSGCEKSRQFHNRNAGCAVAHIVKYFSVQNLLDLQLLRCFLQEHESSCKCYLFIQKNMTVKFSSIYQERKYGCGGELFGLWHVKLKINQQINSRLFFHLNILMFIHNIDQIAFLVVSS